MVFGEPKECLRHSIYISDSNCNAAAYKQLTSCTGHVRFKLHMQPVIPLNHESHDLHFAAAVRKFLLLTTMLEFTELCDCGVCTVLGNLWGFRGLSFAAASSEDCGLRVILYIDHSWLEVDGHIVQA